jgi:quinol-cytochrome oxidoreductase complex cytochrome b subunit
MHPTEEATPRPGFWAQRTGWRPLKQLLFLEPLPGGARWTAAFGSLLLFTLVLQIVTGVLLAMNYAPSAETAWQSVNYIQEEVFLGDLVRGMHHWGSSAMVILMLLHLIQVFVWGAYKKPRELTWMVGVLLLFLVLGLAFTGYLLPWDQKAYWATKVGLGIASTTPVIGDGLRTVLQGGPEMGNLTVTRFYSLHTFVLPGLLILLLVVHLYLFRLHGVTPGWWHSEAQLKAREEPFWPRQAWMDGVLAVLLLSGLGLWTYYHAAPLEAQADPSQPYEARPEWYFMFLFQALRYFEGPYEIVGTFVLPTLVFLLLFFWPFLDRSRHRDPRRRPVAMTLLSLGTVGLVGLTVVAIATDVRMREPELATTVPAEEKPGPIQRLEVAKVYNAHCAACHGVDGSGKLMRKGMPTIPDFTSLAWQLSQTDLEIVHRIQDGNEPLMPAYGDKLTKSQIIGLGVYVRAFSFAPGEKSVGKKPRPPRRIEAGMSAVKVYRDNCLLCHDADGRGKIAPKGMGKMPDFTSDKWQESRTDPELRHSILEGKGKLMPPMKNLLGKEDVTQMVKLVRAFRGGKQTIPVKPDKLVVPPPSDKPVVVVPETKPPPKKRRPPKRDAGAAAQVRLATGLYRQYCLKCHGTSGGGGPMRSSMPAIPNFTQRAWQKKVSNPQLEVSILDGKGGLMPAFRGRLSRAQARALVAYLRAFGPDRPGPRKKAPAGDFEERFRKLQDEWDELQRQLDRLKTKRGKE